MCTICYPSSLIHRRQNKVLGFEVFDDLDPDSRRTEIAASTALPVVTRNGLSEVCIVSSTWCKIDSSVAPNYSEIIHGFLRGTVIWDGSMHTAGCACGICTENSLRLLEQLLANYE
jgi:hypothetical protein